VLARSDATELQANGIRLEMIDSETSQLKEKFTAPIECVRRKADEIAATDCVVIAAKSTVNHELIESL
jgi:ketopantoate reductase